MSPYPGGPPLTLLGRQCSSSPLVSACTSPRQSLHTRVVHHPWVASWCARGILRRSVDDLQGRCVSAGTPSSLAPAWQGLSTVLVGVPLQHPPEETSLGDEQRRVGLSGAHMPRGWGASAQWQGRDAEGIDVAVIPPSRGLFALTVPELEFRAELRLSRFMVDCASHNRRSHRWHIDGSRTCRSAQQHSWM